MKLAKYDAHLKNVGKNAGRNVWIENSEVRLAARMRQWIMVTFFSIFVKRKKKKTKTEQTSK